MWSKIRVLQAQGETWAAEVDRLRGRLGAPNNPLLFPPQYLKVSLPKIGGRIVLFESESDLLGVGLLFPRALAAGRPTYTLRFHRLHPAFQPRPEQLTRRIEERLGTAQVLFYDPLREQCYERTSARMGEFDIGRPDAAESAAVRQLQQHIWQSEPDFLYPADIHAASFGASTSLVVRAGQQVIGFLFAFFKFASNPFPQVWEHGCPSSFRIESQLLGVLPAYRGRSLGFLLKKAQAEEALREDIHVINWTVDPLQYRNAVLNFGKLRALAFSFHPNYYPYRNVLNRVPASRLEITWLVRTERVRRALSDSTGHTWFDLSEDETIPRVNDAWAVRRLGLKAPRIAIEIPADWTRLQQEDLQEALCWRETLDVLLAHYLGLEEGRYVISGVGEDGPRKYLIAERVDRAESHVVDRGFGGSDASR